MDARTSGWVGGEGDRESERVMVRLGSKVRGAALVGDALRCCCVRGMLLRYHDVGG